MASGESALKVIARPASARDALAPPAGSRLSRRRFLALAVATSSAVLSGCSSAWPQASPRPGEKVQLVYQDWRTEWFPGMVRSQLDVFHETHPNIRVFFTPDPENLEEKMLADMQAGTAADVFQGCCAHFPIWAQKGFTLDLTRYAAADVDRDTIDDWDEAQYKSLFTRDGRLYGLPKYHGALAVYYNKDYFEAYKVDYPDASWNYLDYRQAMRKLTRDLNGDGTSEVFGSMVDISWDRLQMYVNGWGGHFVDPADPTVSLLAEPQALDGLRWLRARMWDDRVMASLPDVRKLGTAQAFAAGRLAMVEDGSWALKSILSSAQFKVGVAPYPAGPVRRATLATTDGFGIYSGTKHPDAAWELVKFLISKDYGRAMARANFLQPARRSLVDEWVGMVRAQYPSQTEGMDIAAFADGHIKGYSVTAEIFANMEDARRLAYEAWDKIFTLGQMPVEAMIEVSRQIQSTQGVGKGGAGKCC